LEHVKRLDNSWNIFRVTVFLEHMCFVVLGVMGMEGQETERFLGARKLNRLLDGWDDSIVSLWASGKRMFGSIFLLLEGLHCKWSSSRDLGEGILLGMFCYVSI
jgi:hypothetical protein